MDLMLISHPALEDLCSQSNILAGAERKSNSTACKRGAKEVKLSYFSYPLGGGSWHNHRWIMFERSKAEEDRKIGRRFKQSINAPEYSATAWGEYAGTLTTCIFPSAALRSSLL